MIYCSLGRVVGSFTVALLEKGTRVIIAEQVLIDITLFFFSILTWLDTYCNIWYNYF